MSNSLPARRISKLVVIISLTALCGMLLGLTAAAQDKLPAKDPIILKGAPMGGVKFDHKAHVEAAGKKCDTCHHASKPEKAAKSAQEACTNCHTKPPQAGMKTGLQAAFHNPTAKAGTCIDCHTKSVTGGKKAPAKCPECHKKENV